MASLLFQSGKATSSSSSSSSSAANPFQALAHFYEQELSDLQIDSRLQQQQQQQQQQQHSASEKQKSTNHLFPSSYTRKDITSFSASQRNHHPQDDYKIFSQTASTQWSPYSRSHLHITSPSAGGEGHADISEYLKQREDYYTREARLRSQDRHDGLGPIVDFSEPHSHGHLGHYHHHPHVISSRLEDQLLDSAFGQSRHNHHRGSQGLTQLEQVWMDLGPDSVPVHNSTDANWSRNIDSAWNKLSERTTLSPGSTLSPDAHLVASPTPSSVSNFRQAAASLHSPWPMAAWAIEAEAALMEVETIHYQHTANYDARVHSSTYMYHQQEIQTTTTGPQNATWAQEFSHAESATKAAISNSSNIRKEAESASQDMSEMRRELAVKTCGFILESKNHRDASDPTFLDPDVLNFKASNSQSRLDDHHSAVSTSPPGLLALKQTSAPYSPIDNGSAHPHPVSMPHMEDIGATVKEQPGQVFNDELFEGDMLQAWMETLAQEKQEADQRVQEAGQVEAEEVTLKKSVEETQDQLVLEVALRRLNVLMHQLGRTQTSLSSPFGSTDTSSKSKLPPILPARDHIHTP
ncbi:hypothetical protein BG015_008762 [Linnemannia schmuckeri]|uniref:Uncharacterized protein n=1 Tax=Linnemannia schmuckeri TaxID=64567 RepID=A0A9P5VA24_9FUNG|nr:hypothetical protein BG015_008762 [Linnemannia schmuckeri]